MRVMREKLLIERRVSRSVFFRSFVCCSISALPLSSSTLLLGNWCDSCAPAGESGAVADPGLPRTGVDDTGLPMQRRNLHRPGRRARRCHSGHIVSPRRIPTSGTGKDLRHPLNTPRHHKRTKLRRPLMKSLCRQPIHHRKLHYRVQGSPLSTNRSPWWQYVLCDHLSLLLGVQQGRSLDEVPQTLMELSSDQHKPGSGPNLDFARLSPSSSVHAKFIATT
ncbi:hypothetical protein FB566_0900 [Stackebrandtia endophytica]|uniref:Uncharacterized protein n=1 Tax=Stackebrandtia endophytica TaxID=1496996 RepID=A0A543AS44_9ACTN|nr:hypothetical protein FB566_0900 [Stackebrandtia endophytica]